MNPYQDSIQDTLSSPPPKYDVFVSKFDYDHVTYNEIVNPGTNVSAFGINGQTITFDSVGTSGTVTVEYATSGPVIGSNLVVIPASSPIYYNVSTNADFVGNVEVCFTYDPTGIISEDSVKLYHYDSAGNWIDVTTSLDIAANIVCDVTDHFSPFVVLASDIALSVEQIDSPNLPDNFSLSQNYPNPFNPETNIEFNLKTRSHVKIEIFNMLGRKVKTLVNNSYGVGSYIVNWDGTNEYGNQVSSGMYLYRFSVDGFVATKKMMLLK